MYRAVKKSICFISGSRADYGLLKWLIREVHNDEQLDMSIIATGSHLSERFGNTASEIESDGFQIDVKIPLDLDSDSRINTARAFGECAIGIADAVEKLNPDLVVLLGDRYEIFAAATATYLLGKPIAHIHGGEVTHGSFDDGIRHSITKLSQIHFVANAEYAKRVMQLGESPGSIHIVGGLGVDAIDKTPVIPFDDLANSLNVRFSEQNFLVTYHPETVDTSNKKVQVKELLAALSDRSKTSLFITLPNSDPNNAEIRAEFHEFGKRDSNIFIFESLGQTKYLSLLRRMDGVIGNSSSGIIEAPYLGIPTVNIGSRQSGRVKAASIVDCDNSETAIRNAIHKIMSNDFRAVLKNAESSYGDPGASGKILAIIKCLDFEKMPTKAFFDLPSQS
jgi:GDP/UDP-N,N'-diacetylbacillosamine 2-epimerase (hydrolysing)